MKKFFIIFICMFSTHTYCVQPNPFVNALHKKLNTFQTMSAHFKQTVIANDKKIDRSNGEFILKRPGKMRWHTKSPMEQLIVANGKKLWIYDVDLEQVTVTNQSKNSNSASQIFLNDMSGDVGKDFKVKQLSQGNNNVFELEAKSDKENIHLIKLYFTHNKLTQLKFYDRLGQVTDIVFSNIKINQPIKNSKFTFSVPNGVDIIHQS